MDDVMNDETVSVLPSMVEKVVLLRPIDDADKEETVMVLPVNVEKFA